MNKFESIQLSKCWQICSEQIINLFVPQVSIPKSLILECSLIGVLNHIIHNVLIDWISYCRADLRFKVLASSHSSDNFKEFIPTQVSIWIVFMLLSYFNVYLNEDSIYVWNLEVLIVNCLDFASPIWKIKPGNWWICWFCDQICKTFLKLSPML